MPALTAARFTVDGALRKLAAAHAAGARQHQDYSAGKAIVPERPIGFATKLVASRRP